MASRLNGKFSVLNLMITILLFLFMVCTVCIFFDGNGVFIYETF